jgi:hypothetical protein
MIMQKDMAAFIYNTVFIAHKQPMAQNPWFFVLQSHRRLVVAYR